MAKAEKYLKYLRDEIHSVVFATVDDEGKPATCAIDLMLADADSLYFLTATGKAFYDRLCAHPYVSLTGLKGEDTLSCVAVTVRGKVREVGPGLLPEIFSQNPYMAKIYPDEAGRRALIVFQLFEGEGEFFDLSALPVFRETFSFGGGRVREDSYQITDRCTGCGICLDVCPQRCIDCVRGSRTAEADCPKAETNDGKAGTDGRKMETDDGKAGTDDRKMETDGRKAGTGSLPRIRQENCIRCGVCLYSCPADAVVRIRT